MASVSLEVPPTTCEEIIDAISYWSSLARCSASKRCISICPRVASCSMRSTLFSSRDERPLDSYMMRTASAEAPWRRSHSAIEMS